LQAMEKLINVFPLGLDEQEQQQEERKAASTLQGAQRARAEALQAADGGGPRAEDATIGTEQVRIFSYHWTGNQRYFYCTLAGT